MRIRRIQLVGLAAVIVGGATGTAQAGDLVITTTGHAPVTTSNANSGPGDVTINSGGSITITTAGTSGVTVDDSHDVTINSGGSISASNLNDVTGVHVLTGNTGDIINSGSINLLEDYTLADTDSDGDLDGDFATGLHRYGILLDAGTHTGNISNAGSIQIEGNQSAAIRLDGALTGNLTADGGISVYGEDSYGVLIGGGVSGDVILRGGGLVKGQNSIGVAVNGDIGGVLRINGNWTGTGYLSTVPVSDESHLEPGDLEQSGPLVSIAADVNSGFIVEGYGVENDVDDDGDGITEAAGDTNDNATANLQIYGSAPAVQIASTGAGDITLSASTYGYGFVNRGSILADGVYQNMTATAVSITGTAGTNANIAGGMVNDHGIGATAANANAYVLRIGQHANVPLLLNRGNFAALMIGDDADNAYAIYLDPLANLGAINNSGIIASTVQGHNGDAYVIYDASGSLNSITNSGTIIASIRPATGDPNASAETIAIDVSANVSGVTITQNADTPFTDDDTVDNDVDNRPDVTIIGNIRLGSGADTLNINAGTVIGDVSFGAGLDQFTINNGASYTGQISDSGGDLNINVTDGLMNLRGGAANISSASFSADSQLRILLSGNNLDPPVLTSSGTITFSPGAVLSINLPTGLPVSNSQVFLVANGGLFGGSNVTGAISGSGTPFLYDLNIALTNPMAADGAPNGLEATYALKTPAALGLGSNGASAFDAIIGALRLDTTTASAVLAIDNQADFLKAYGQLLPSYASGATEVATTAIQQMQSASTNRLAATRLHNLHDTSVWGQEIGYGMTRDAPDVNAQAFRGAGFGFAAGIDAPLDNGAIFGLSASFLASEVEEPARRDGQISANFGQVNAYLGTAMGDIDLDFVGGVGAGKLKSRRFVNIGDTYSAIAEADWWAYEVHGAARASMPLNVSDWLVISPQAQLTYVGINEQGYTEDGGGAAIDYDVDSAFSQRLWADVGVEFAGHMRFRGESVLSPRLYIGYRANVLNDETERTFQFVSGGPSFNLTDESVGNGGPLVGIGIDASNGFSTFSLSYEGEFTDQIERHSLNAAVRFRF